jgi:4-aminobutyrate aminotransferase/(S)-3-amino-2-methylpropionate transaminase
MGRMRNENLESRRQSALPRGVAASVAFYAERASGSELWDVEGRRYIDFVGGMGALGVGHGHQAVLTAIEKQLKRFTHTFFGSTPYELYIGVAERLNRVAPFSSPAKTLLVTTGAEAVENAVKIARFATGRSGVIVFSGGFHGRTLFTLGMTSQVIPYKQGFSPFPPDIFRIPFPNAYRGITVNDSLEALERLFESEIEADRIAAIVVEPVQGEGGFLVAPSGFLRALRDISKRNGIQLIVDEIQCGFGRTGKFFAVEHSGVEPDMIAVGKSLAAGLPLAAVVGASDLMDVVPPGGLGGTYAGNPLACAASLAVFDIMESENLLDRAVSIGERMRAAFDRLRTGRDGTVVGEVRGVGAMIGIELVQNFQSRIPNTDLTTRIIRDAAQNGLLLASAGNHHNVIRILVALTISDEVLDQGIDILCQSFERQRSKQTNQ